MSEDLPPPATKRPGRTPLLSDAECREIAAEFDGTTPTVDALLVRWQLRYPGLRRHNVIQAARRGGYTPAASRRRWTASEDDFLRTHWQRLCSDEIAATLGRSVHSVGLRRRRLQFGRYEGDAVTLSALEKLTGLGPRQWQEVIDKGWLEARRNACGPGAAPLVSLSVPRLLALLRRHPEVYAYRDAPADVRRALQLDTLPDPPGWKQVICRAPPACAAAGGSAFWAPLYALPTCPRCGVPVSRYCERGRYADRDPGEDDVLRTPARPRGLEGRDAGSKLRARVSAQENLWLSTLGWVKAGLKRHA